MVALKKKHGSCMVSVGSGEYSQISAYRCVPVNTVGHMTYCNRFSFNGLWHFLNPNNVIGT